LFLIFGQLQCNEQQRSRHVLVRLVDIVDGDDGQVAVVAVIAESHTGAGLGAGLLDGGGRHIQADGHGKNIAVGQTLGLDDAVAGILVSPSGSRDSEMQGLRGADRRPKQIRGTHLS
jgi:hypothetical protein